VKSLSMQIFSSWVIIVNLRILLLMQRLVKLYLEIFSNLRNKSCG